MGVVTSYNRTSGRGLTSSLPGSSGTLRSTRQQPPYVHAPYKSIRIFNDPVKVNFGSGVISSAALTNSALQGDSALFPFGPLDQKAIETARGRLNNRLVKGRAALGITAATANQSFAMIAKRTKTLMMAYKAIKSGNVRKLERTLGLKRSTSSASKELRFTKHRLPPHIVKHFKLQAHKASRRKRISRWERPEDVWLEYTFGWMPLVADVQSVLKVSSDPFEVERSFGTCSNAGVANFRDPNRGNIIAEKKVRAVCTAGIRVTNPNLALSTQLGLTNPLLVAWDIIPFSFVVDWFFKVNTFLSRFNDLAGFSYVAPVTTVTKEALVLNWNDKAPSSVAVSKGRFRERTLSIPNKPVYPRLVLPAPNLWLAATSTALALQVFRSK